MNQQTNEYIERHVVKLTRLAHPKDLGAPTSKLEDELRIALTETWNKSRLDAIEEIGINAKFLEVARCPDADCDNKGTIAVRISDDEWEPQQCQWCDERRKAIATLSTMRQENGITLPAPTKR